MGYIMGRIMYYGSCHESYHALHRGSYHDHLNIIILTTIDILTMVTNIIVIFIVLTTITTTPSRNTADARPTQRPVGHNRDITGTLLSSWPKLIVPTFLALLCLFALSTTLLYISGPQAALSTSNTLCTFQTPVKQIHHYHLPNVYQMFSRTLTRATIDVALYG